MKKLSNLNTFIIAFLLIYIPLLLLEIRNSEVRTQKYMEEAGYTINK